MDLTPTAEQEALRAECRVVAAGQPALGVRQRSAAALRRPGRRGRLRAGVAAPPGRGPLGGRDLARGLRRARRRARWPTTSCRRSWPEPGRPSWSAASASTWWARRCWPTAPTTRSARWLPTILAADLLFCQLFSEPDAGSDLASVSTRAVRTERRRRGRVGVDGQKVWTSYAQFADWGLCLARTNPDVRKQAGITALAIDMRSPGRRGATAAAAHRRDPSSTRSSSTTSSCPTTP